MDESKYIRDMDGVKSCFDLISHLDFKYDLYGAIIGLYRNWVLAHFNFSNQIGVYKCGWDC